LGNDLLVTYQTEGSERPRGVLNRNALLDQMKEVHGLAYTLIAQKDCLRTEFLWMLI